MGEVVEEAPRACTAVYACALPQGMRLPGINVCSPVWLCGAHAAAHTHPQWAARFDAWRRRALPQPSVAVWCTCSCAHTSKAWPAPSVVLVEPTAAAIFKHRWMHMRPDACACCPLAHDSPPDSHRPHPVTSILYPTSSALPPRHTPTPTPIIVCPLVRAAEA